MLAGSVVSHARIDRTSPHRGRHLVSSGDRPSRRRVLGLLAAGTAMAGTGIGIRSLRGDDTAGRAISERASPTSTSSADTTTSTSSTSTSTTEPTIVNARPVEPYVTISGEVEPEAKQVAAGVAEALTTYRADEDPSLAVARALALTATPLALALDRAEPLLHAGQTSWGEVVYPQLGGLDPHSAPRRCSVMVVLDQHLESDLGRRTIGRCLDLRLHRGADGTWQLEDIGDVSGTELPRPTGASAAVQAVLDHPTITMPDSVRWDLDEGFVDGRVLDELVRLADRTPIAVTSCRRGHPEHVFGTNRVSAHMVGRAVDVWSVGGALVQQREVGSAAYELTRDIALSGRIGNLGSPWAFGSAAPGSFTDPVHQDHLHLGFR